MASIPLVLVPGLVCDAEIWRHQIDHLADIASITVAPATEGETMADMAERALAVCPDTFALAGFSMGGYVALEMLRQAPRRISRLAMLDTSARPDTAEKSAYRRDVIARCANGGFGEVIEDMLQILLHPDHQRPPHTDFVRAMASRVGAETFARRHGAIMTRADGRDILERADIPVRVVFGRQDAMSTLEEHREIADLAPRGRLSIIEDCGHMTLRERPEAATALLRDWLVYD